MNACTRACAATGALAYLNMRTRLRRTLRKEQFFLFALLETSTLLIAP
jgi:hypothetical protein